MSTLREFTISAPRTLPVIILADISGSMAADHKIDILNGAIAEMLSQLSEENTRQVSIQVAIVTFGGNEAMIHQPLAAVGSFQWHDMTASGRTPMGAAFDLARTLIEDKDQIPSRSYTPTLVLVSDGIPTDDWQTLLDSLLKCERGSKAIRLALAIGADAKIDVLERFVSDSENPVFQAHEVRQIGQFFRYVTMSVSSRSRSHNPNVMNTRMTDWDDMDY